MNIPDDVLEQAHQQGEGNDADYRFMAEWARKDALEQAQQTLATLTPDTAQVNFDTVDGWTLGKQAAFNAIRDLAARST